VTTQVLLITGTMGAGKTTLMGEASDLLAERDVAHAAIDLDALGIGMVPAPPTTGPIRSDGLSPAIEQLQYRNLADVWRNFQRAGIIRLLLAAAIEQRELPMIQDALGSLAIVVCRVRAPLATMQERVRWREPGMFQKTFVERVAELDALLDAANLEEFTVTNHDRPVSDVAIEMLSRAGWICPNTEPSDR